MATYVEKITKDTANESKFNSKDVSRRIHSIQRGIHDYLNKNTFKNRAGLSLSDPDFAIIAEDTTANIIWYAGKAKFSSDVWAYCGTASSFNLKTSLNEINNTDDSNVPFEQTWLNVEKATSLVELSNEVLNIEEDDLNELVICDDYIIEGLSIHSKEAQIFHKELDELRKKYGISI